MSALGINAWACGLTPADNVVLEMTECSSNMAKKEGSVQPNLKTEFSNLPMLSVDDNVFQKVPLKWTEPFICQQKHSGCIHL